MELNSSFARLLRAIEDVPQIMVFFAAFGVFFYMILLGLVLWLFQAYIKNEIYNTIIKTYFYALGITWIVGFITQILLVFLGVSGLHLLAIWLTLHLISILFCAFNFHSIDGNITRLTEEKKNKISKKK
ncbi:hypothetical protein ACK1KB_13075 [Chryseobacterium sp. TY3]